MYDLKNENYWLFFMFVLFLIGVYLICTWIEYITGTYVNEQHKK